MGKLKHSRWHKVRRIVLAWLLPAVLSGAVIFGVNSFAKADTPPSTDELASYLKHNSLNVGVDSLNGYQQIFYMFNGKKIYLTGANYSHTNPVVSGELVAWEGLVDNSSQIFEYDVLTHTLTQLTTSGTNQNPSIHGDIVTWEGWTDGHWAVFYYDGFQVYQVTTGNTSSVRPRSDGKSIIFAEQDADGTWKTYSYDLKKGEYFVLNSGDEPTAGYPKFDSKDKVTSDAKSFFR